MSRRENIFFRWGVNVFDYKKKEYGGYNHWIARYIFRNQLAYLTIYLKKEWKLELIHNDDEYYYDGFHDSLWVGPILFSYGT